MAKPFSRLCVQPPHNYATSRDLWNTNFNCARIHLFTQVQPKFPHFLKLYSVREASAHWKLKRATLSPQPPIPPIGFNNSRRLLRVQFVREIDSLAVCMAEWTRSNDAVYMHSGKYVSEPGSRVLDSRVATYLRLVGSSQNPGTPNHVGSYIRIAN